MTTLKTRETELLSHAHQALMAWVQWEADLLMCDEVWAGGLPRFTQEIYDCYCDLRCARNAVITEIDRLELREVHR